MALGPGVSSCILSGTFIAARIFSMSAGSTRVVSSRKLWPQPSIGTSASYRTAQPKSSASMRSCDWPQENYLTGMGAPCLALQRRGRHDLVELGQHAGVVLREVSDRRGVVEQLPQV